jgi:tetratricopeptide (TPR) repeat protein
MRRVTLRRLRANYTYILPTLLLWSLTVSAYGQGARRGAAGPRPASEAGQYSRWASMLEGVSREDLVIAQTTAALRSNPRNAIALRMRSGAYYSKFEWEKAKADAEAVVRILTAPKTAEEFEARCQSYRRLNRRDEALADCARAIEINPKFLKARVTKGGVYFDKGDYAQSLAEMSLAVEVDPGAAYLYRSRGLVFHYMKKYDGAIADFNKAIALDPRGADAYAFRGLSQSAKDNHDGAVADYTTAILHYPGYVFAYYNRALSYKRKREFDRAIQDFTKAISLFKKDSSLFYERGLTYYLYKDDNEKALLDFDEAIRLNPEDANSFYWRARVHARGKDGHVKAILDYTRAIELAPVFAGAYGGRADAYAAIKEYDRAIADMAKAVELQPTNSRYQALGDLYFDKEDWPRAVSSFTKAIELDPSDSDSYANRGGAYNNMEYFDHAIADYTKLIGLLAAKERRASMAEAYRNRGKVYRNRGRRHIKNGSLLGEDDFYRAIQDYTRAIEIEPRDAGTYYARSIVYLMLGEEAREAADKRMFEQLRAEERQREEEAEKAKGNATGRVKRKP